MISNVEHKSRRTTLMPVTMMEEVPVLTTEERTEFITSLEEAEASIKAGDFIEHDQNLALCSISRSKGMTYRLFITPRAQREIQEFVERLRAYSEDFAEEQLARLSFEVSTYRNALPVELFLPYRRSVPRLFVSYRSATSLLDCLFNRRY